MAEMALGLIETVGFVAAVEAADAAAKAAEVQIERLQYTGHGLITVIVTGELSPVQAAVDCGEKAALKVGTIHSVTVIGRQGEGVSTLVSAEKERSFGRKEVVSAPEIPRMTVSQLRRKRVVELREILLSQHERVWTKEEIEGANKNTLIAMVEEMIRDQS